MRGDFTLSYHFFRPLDIRNHLELFLDTDGASALQTWRSFRSERNATAQRGRRFVAAPEHRREYLTFSGLLTDNRGRLRILRRGKFIDRRTGAGAKGTSARTVLVTL